MTVFEVLQLLLAVGIGFEGAARLIGARHGSAPLLGLVALALGLLSYGVAFVFVERWRGRGANFFVYSTSGWLFLLFGSFYLLPPALQAASSCSSRTFPQATRASCSPVCWPWGSRSCWWRGSSRPRAAERHARATVLRTSSPSGAFFAAGALALPSQPRNASCYFAGPRGPRLPASARARADTGEAMKALFEDYEHLARVAALFGGAALLFLVLQQVMVPSGFGLYGHYRAGALDDNRAPGLVFAGQAACADCHADQATARNEGKHAGLACEACHGALARHATDPQNTPERPHGRVACLTCHTKNVAKPASFPQVDPGEHAGTGLCTECHAAHKPELGS